MTDFLIKQTKMGKAVFANKLYKKGELILQFYGEIYSIDSGKIPEDFYAENNHYLQIGDQVYMGPTDTTDNFVNHSCNPNARVMINEKVTLLALKDIPKGEEITFDYSIATDEDDWEMECFCGHKECRKKIGSFKFLPDALQKKYIKMGIVPDFVLKNKK